ncbi:hypothetical protein [Paludibaculum fermentans]|uniref:hypothetical protein n=1 Tax=Paludibaculum fermentans TaxID=1473598 RepID=UPI003EBAA355
MGVFGNTRIGERINAQLRWETFNTRNYTQFGPDNTSVTSANSGKTTGILVGPRRMQFGLRLTY